MIAALLLGVKLGSAFSMALIAVAVVVNMVIFLVVFAVVCFPVTFTVKDCSAYANTISVKTELRRNCDGTVFLRRFLGIKYACPALLNQAFSFSLKRRKNVLTSLSATFPSVWFDEQICFPRYVLDSTVVR